jgi:type IV pilus assembly protein PilN
MLEINLLPVREARRKADLRQYFMQLLLLALLALGAIALVESRISDQISRSEARVAQLRNDIDQFKPQLEQVAAFKKRKSELEKKIDVIDGLDKARSGPVRVLDELATHTPDRLWLTGLTVAGTTLSLKGESLDNELVALFLRKLGDSAWFDQVDLDSTKLNNRKGLKVVEFNVRAELVRPPEPAAAGATQG